MMHRIHAVKQFLAGHTIAVGLGLAVVTALILTTVSVSMYNLSDVSRIDISRPGYEDAREAVIKGDETIDFSATGELSSDDMKDFQNLFDDKRSQLNAIGKFDGDMLSDKQLNTTATSE